MRPLFAVILLALSCSRQSAPPPFTLRIAAAGTLAPIEPTLTETWSSLLRDLVFEPLLIPNTDGKLHSSVLAHWGPSGDRALRLQLLPGLVFSDGTPVTHRDLVASLEAAGQKATDEGDAVLVETALSPAAALWLLTTTALARGAGLGAVGTGPFVVEAQSPQRIRLRRRQRLAHRIEAVELVSVPSPRDGFAQVLRGEANALVEPATGELELLRDVPGLQVVQAPGIHAQTLLFNSAVLSPQERRSLADALPLGELTRAFGPGCVETPSRRRPGPLPPGRALHILAGDVSETIRIARALHRALGERAGSLEIVGTTELVARARRGEFELLVAPFLDWPPERLAMNWRSSDPGNLSHYSNPAFDAALRDGDLLRQTELLEADPPIVSICRMERVAVVDARLRNARLGPFDFFQSLPDWEVSP